MLTQDDACLCCVFKVDEALNGGPKNQKKSRKRFRGWSRRTRRPYACKRSPQGGAATTTIKVCAL